MAKSRGSLLWLFVIICSCTSERMGQEQLMQYVLDEKHGLYHQEGRSGTIVEMYYKPAELLAYQSLQQEKLPVQKLDSLKKSFAQHLYFVVNISHEGKDLEWYTGTHIKADIFTQAASSFSLRTDAGEEVALKGYLVPRLAGISDKSSFLLAFDNVLPSRSLTSLRLRVEDLGLGTGSFEKQFEIQHIQRIPKLN